MAKGRRLKVFQAQFGFYDTVVAAPSQAAALQAWDTRQNLFADGQAWLADDAQAVRAALDHPGTPLRRAVGSTDPFGLEPAGLPNIPDAPRREAASPQAKARRPERPPADRSALDAAQAALRKFEDRRKAEEADFRRRQAALDEERNAAQSAYVEGHKAMAATVADARQAYRKAGGED